MNAVTDSDGNDKFKGIKTVMEPTDESMCLIIVLFSVMLLTSDFSSSI